MNRSSVERGDACFINGPSFQLCLELTFHLKSLGSFNYPLGPSGTCMSCCVDVYTHVQGDVFEE